MSSQAQREKDEYVKECLAYFTQLTKETRSARKMTRNWLSANQQMCPPVSASSATPNEESKESSSSTQEPYPSDPQNN